MEKRKRDELEKAILLILGNGGSTHSLDLQWRLAREYDLQFSVSTIKRVLRRMPQIEEIDMGYKVKRFRIKREKKID